MLRLVIMVDRVVNRELPIILLSGCLFFLSSLELYGLGIIPWICSNT